MRGLERMKNTLPLPEFVAEVIQKTHYLAHLAEDKESFQERKENIDAFINKAYEWSKEFPEGLLENFLEELTLKSATDESTQETERVQLMTIHNSKGLEFLVAFLVGMEETLFPHVNSLNKPELVEEERRLCYVGLTRARKHLFLTHAQARNLWGSLRLMTPSRFLREIPASLLKSVRFK